MGKYRIDAGRDVNAGHIGDVINYQPARSTEFEQVTEGEQVNTTPAISSLATLLLGFVATTADVVSLLPGDPPKSIGLLFTFVPLVFVLANLPTIRLVVGFGRKSQPLFGKRGEILYKDKRGGSISKAVFQADCIVTGCNGELRVTNPKYLGDGHLEAYCSDCPNEHLYYVDQNLVAHLK